ncbi:TMV resistance protein N [Morus notabilis]|uniref:TMV resistance protein N n=1 Tax=Morus notabilis TaxID=981085 RepID=W9QLS2_9ROSA|nr:TMV resistance protein N [Morus notabilis]
MDSSSSSSSSPSSPSPSSPSSSSSPPSSPSSSSSSNARTYDVFLSFRGEDTRKTFTGHLYSALTDAGVNAFIDDRELPKGENIPEELVRAIQGSRISVVVFSRNYADSSWCLEELVKIMECRRTVRQMMIPVFYDVDPSDVRKQTGIFSKSFEKHEKWFLSDSEKVLRWRSALTEAANLSGWDLRNTADGHEAKFIKKITEEILRQLKNTYLFEALYPVGIDSRVRVMTSLLNISEEDEVRMVGILGMGGMGKTTIAKAIYNRLYDSFEGRCFLGNVRETWNRPNCEVSLQEQLLSDILKRKVKLNNPDRGIMEIKDRLCRMRILLVVDNIDDADQLKAVAGSRDWFGFGSRIIITTRNMRWHAFRRSFPDKDYVQLSGNVAAYCGGLPLALEVLGSFLFGRSIPEWENAIKKLERIPHNKIQEKLKISYEALTDETIQEMFLDISCFFVGMDRNYVLQILDGCGFFAEIGISVLLQRCLVTINEENKLTMHGLLRDMGRDIVRKESPKELGKRSRLWHQEDVIDVLTKETGTQKIEGLSLKRERHNIVGFNTQAFAIMQGLRLLQLYYVKLNGSYEYLSKELRWLCWHGFPMKFIPNEFYLGNLVALNMKYSNLKNVWKNPKLLEKMKILNLSHSHYLTRTPDFSKLPNLSQLILKDCRSLYEVHHSIGYLDKLVLVNLKDCKILKSLPKDFYKLRSLETLILSGCSQFENLDEDLGEMLSLATLDADNTAIRNVPFTIVRLMNLRHLSLCGLKASPSKPFYSLIWSWLMGRKNSNPTSFLPPSLQGLSSLTTLSLTDCHLADDAIPKDIGTSLPSLVILKLQNNKFSRLPSSFGRLSNLKDLRLDNCTMLQSIPNLPASLEAFYATNCTSLENLPNMSKMSNMQILSLANCHKLVASLDMDNLLKLAITLQRERCNSISTSFSDSILQECKESGGFCVLPGNIIPEWFTHSKEGSIVCIEVPQLVGCNVVALVVCTVYSSFPTSGMISLDLPTISVITNTKGGEPTRMTITTDIVISEEDNIWLGYFSNDTFKLEGGDMVNISFDFGVRATVKKTGVHFLWDKCDDSIKYISRANGYTTVLGDDDDVAKHEARIRAKRLRADEEEVAPSHRWSDEHNNNCKRMKVER